MKNRNLAFAALVLTALGSFLLFYPVYRWSETLAFGSMILGVALSLVSSAGQCGVAVAGPHALWSAFLSAAIASTRFWSFPASLWQ